MNIIQRLKTFVHLCLKYRKTLYKLKNKYKKKILIIGTPVHGNIGDLAIAESEINFFNNTKCRENNITVIDITTEILPVVLKFGLIKENDLLCCHGGGNMGIDYMVEEEIRRNVIQKYKKNKILIFPQTIDYGTSQKGRDEFNMSIEIYSNHPNLTIYAREEYSYNILKKFFIRNTIKLVPDIVLSNHFYSIDTKRKNILLCMRNDIEKNINNDIVEELKQILVQKNLNFTTTDTSSPNYVGVNERFEIISNKLSQFCSARLIITDRLHGMIFSYLTKTPCIVFSNSNYKVKGVYNRWLKDFDYIKFQKNYDKSIFLNELDELLSCKIDITENPLVMNFETLKDEINEWVVK